MYVNRPIMSWDTQDLESVGNRMRSLSPACVTPAVVCSASVQIVHSIGIIQCQALVGVSHKALVSMFRPLVLNQRPSEMHANWADASFLTSAHS